MDGSTLMDNDIVGAFGRYFGRLILEPLPDGRLMRVIEPFGFINQDRDRWPVPSGTKIDGASIPQALWSLVGGPFEGKYRNASVVHDYYCDVRIKPWRTVHRMFFNAMRCSGVSEQRAKLMYAAVYFGGPRWSDTVVDNANLPRHDVGPDIMYSVNHTEFEEGVLDAVDVGGESASDLLKTRRLWPKGDEMRLHLNQLEALLASSQPTLSEIDKAIEASIDVLEPLGSQHRVHTRTVVP
jgi:hypothetical protein